MYHIFLHSKGGCCLNIASHELINGFCSCSGEVKLGSGRVRCPSFGTNRGETVFITDNLKHSQRLRRPTLARAAEPCAFSSYCDARFLGRLGRVFLQYLDAARAPEKRASLATGTEVVSVGVHRALQSNQLAFRLDKKPREILTHH